MRACWSKVGQQRRIPVPAAGSKQRAHVIGAYNWRSDSITWQTVAWKNSEHFIGFLEHLLVRIYPTAHVILVMDNVSYHHSGATLAALSLFEHRLQLIWLPAYCSDLNPIERFWRHLKDLACANKLEADLPALVTTVERTLAHQNQPDHPDRFALSKLL